MSGSEDIVRQFNGQIPGQATGQNAVAKTYVDDELAIRDEDISNVANSAAAAQGAINTHEASGVAHSAAAIVYSGPVAAANAKEAIDTVNQRVSTIVAGAGASNTEILDARQPATGPAYPILGDRLNAVDAQLADTAIDLKQRALTPLMFGAVGDGETDDVQAWRDMVTYIESQVKDTEMSYNGKSAGATVIDLVGKIYALSDCVHISPNIALSLVTIRNGTICPTSDFASTDPLATNHLLRIGHGIEGSNSTNIRIDNVIFDAKKQDVRGLYFFRTLNSGARECTFLNIDVGVQLASTQTHETFIDNCYFSNPGTFGVPGESYYGTVAIIVGVDSVVTKNTILGFNDGISVTGGGNLFVNNHIWGLPKLGRCIKTSYPAANNIFDTNYFDGHGIELDRGGFMTSIVNNVFLGCSTYAAIYIKPYSSDTVLQNCTITGNQANFNPASTPYYSPQSITVAGDVLTLNSGTFAGAQIVGATFTVDSIICEVSGYINNTSVYFKASSPVSNGAKTMYLLPQLVSIWQHGSEFTTVGGSFVSQNNKVYNAENRNYGYLGGSLFQFGRTIPQHQSPIDVTNVSHMSTSTTDQMITFSIRPRGLIFIANMAFGAGENFSIGFASLSPITMSNPTANKGLYKDGSTFNNVDGQFLQIKTPTGVCSARVKSVDGNTVTIGWTTTTTNSAEYINIQIMAI